MNLDELRKIAEEVSPEYGLACLKREDMLALLDRVAELEKRKPVQAACYQWRDQRDEAEAAIERVRELHTRDQGYCGACDRLWPCPTIAALDGAPEPEWEYEVRNEVHDFKSDYTPDLEQAKRWAQEDDHDFIVRRRKAGPWLPVGGGGESRASRE